MDKPKVYTGPGRCTAWFMCPGEEERCWLPAGHEGYHDSESWHWETGPDHEWRPAEGTAGRCRHRTPGACCERLMVQGYAECWCECHGAPRQLESG